jgi:predicted nuclease of restriction endonuclease-like RecB superfamily
VGFQPTISVLERAKTVRALERAATAIGTTLNEAQILSYLDFEQRLILQKIGPCHMSLSLSHVTETYNLQFKPLNNIHSGQSLNG